MSYKKVELVNDIPKDAIIFKHSNACPVSAKAKVEMDGLKEEIVLVVVQEQRDLSNKIAEEFDIKHESPQVILVKDGKAVKVFNHFDVTRALVEASLA